jgi:UDP-N-acetylglucosamine 2-epimerase (non-hydrolysing)
MTKGQSLSYITSKVLHGIEDLIEREKPDRILVHGDTTSAMAAALAGFYRKTPVGHVEAGLRSGRIDRPWPEELNRRVIDQVADILFAPTQGAKAALDREGLANRRIVVTGNTGVDTLLGTTERIASDPQLQQRLRREFDFLDPSKRLILVTGHRRESFGEGMRRICGALARLAERPDVEILYPVHLNENVCRPVYELLNDLPSVHLSPPVEYLQFCYLMAHCHVLLTDSGGIQEEAPSLGKPVLVMRDITERPEGVATGVAELVGTDMERIVQSASRLLDNASAYRAMTAKTNPYGDGKAALRIQRALSALRREGDAPMLDRSVDTLAEFAPVNRQHAAS